MICFSVKLVAADQSLSSSLKAHLVLNVGGGGEHLALTITSARWNDGRIHDMRARLGRRATWWARKPSVSAGGCGYQFGYRAVSASMSSRMKRGGHTPDMSCGQG
jgi:hypothetical protein